MKVDWQLRAGGELESVGTIKTIRKGQGGSWPTISAIIMVVLFVTAEPGINVVVWAHTFKIFLFKRKL